MSPVLSNGGGWARISLLVGKIIYMETVEFHNLHCNALVGYQYHSCALCMYNEWSVYIHFMWEMSIPLQLLRDVNTCTTIKIERSNWTTKHSLKLPLPSSTICKTQKRFPRILHRSTKALSHCLWLKDCRTKGVDTEKWEVGQVCWRDIWVVDTEQERLRCQYRWKR